MKRTIVVSRTKFEGQDLTKGEKKLQKHQATEWKAPQTKGEKFRAVANIVKNPSRKFWHPPVCQNCKSETGCKFGRTCFCSHVEAEEQPRKKSKEGGAKGSVVLLKQSTHVGCVSRDSYPRKSILREEGKFGSQRAVKFSNLAPKNI